VPRRGSPGQAPQGLEREAGQADRGSGRGLESV